MTVTAVTSVTRLDDFEYEATLERVREYVEQIEGADQQADLGSLQRCADLMALYEDDHWVEEMKLLKPFKPQRGRPDVHERSDRRFYWWAKKRVTSPVTGRGLAPTTALDLLDAEKIRRRLLDASISLPDGVGKRALKPLVALIKNGREDDVPRVWRDALTQSDGQAPGQATVQEAVTAYKKAVDWKTTAGKRTIESREAKVEQIFDWLVRNSTLGRNKALVSRLAGRLVEEKQWARGEVG